MMLVFVRLTPLGIAAPGASLVFVRLTPLGIAAPGASVLRRWH